jgi:hypothetical protein
LQAKFVPLIDIAAAVHFSSYAHWPVGWSDRQSRAQQIQRHFAVAFVKEAAFMKTTSVRWTASLKIDCASEYFCNDSDHKP